AQAPRARRISSAGKPPHLNVTQALFNAAGDGRTDDRAAIQLASDTAANAGGGSVYLPAGSYLIGAAPSGPGGLLLRSRVTLQGEAPRASVLKLADGVNRHLIYGPSNVESLWGSGSPHGLDGFGLINLELDGNRARN